MFLRNMASQQKTAIHTATAVRTSGVVLSRSSSILVSGRNGVPHVQQVCLQLPEM
jgi:hypothetical protein